MNSVRSMLLLTAYCAGTGLARAGDPPREHADCPMMASGTSGHRHGGDLARRGEEGMGFSQAKTVHHFRLLRDGGAIEVEAKDSADASSRDEIRAHLAHVRSMFAGGDFSIPMFVHDTVPAGVATMKRRAASIRYAYRDLPRGGRVSISTADPDALDAIHDFLRFQIVEHETGDPLAMAAEK